MTTIAHENMSESHFPTVRHSLMCRVHLEKILLEGQRECRVKRCENKLAVVTKVLNSNPVSQVKFRFNELSLISGSIHIARVSESWEVRLHVVMPDLGNLQKEWKNIESSELYEVIVNAINYGLCAGRVIHLERRFSA